MKVKCIDSISYKTVHLQFNASLLIMLSNIYEEVIYYVGGSSMKEVNDLLKKNDITLSNVKRKKLYVYGGESRVDLLLRYLISALLNVIVLIKSQKDDVLIYNFNNLFSLRLINVLNRLYRRKILICCHGELELITEQPKEGGGFFKCLRFLAKDFFLKRKHIHEYISFMVLGDIVLKNLRCYLTETQLSHFISIDHPYVFTKDTKCKNASRDIDISIGTVGLFNKAKGADSLLELVKKVKGTNVNFSVTGRIFYDIERLRNNGVDFVEGADCKSISQAEYMTRISNLDYILFLYKRESYRITASGAVMDAINLQKPIIAIENEYFSYLFEKYGSFGMLFHDVEDMSRYLLENTISFLKEKSLSYNFSTIQKALSPQCQAVILKSKLKQLCLLN